MAKDEGKIYLVSQYNPDDYPSTEEYVKVVAEEHVDTKGEHGFNALVELNSLASFKDKVEYAKEIDPDGDLVVIDYNANVGGFTNEYRNITQEESNIENDDYDDEIDD